MRFIRCAILAAATLSLGCQQDTSPPPPRVAVPPPGQVTVPPREASKPLPPPHDNSADAMRRPPFNDPPLVNQRPPEQAGFVEAYVRVGKPRISLFVDRTLQSDPAYLQPGQFDEAQAAAIDYDAIQNIMLDWIACNGQVTVVSPNSPDAQIDVAVKVHAHATKQTRDGLQIRIVSEAVNIKGGESLGRAVVDVVLPLEKTQINTYTRFLARKLMDDMTGSWLAPPEPAQAPPTSKPSR